MNKKIPTYEKYVQENKQYWKEHQELLSNISKKLMFVELVYKPNGVFFNLPGTIILLTASLIPVTSVVGYSDAAYLQSLFFN